MKFTTQKTLFGYTAKQVRSKMKLVETLGGNTKLQATLHRRGGWTSDWDLVANTPTHLVIKSGLREVSLIK